MVNLASQNVFVMDRNEIWNMFMESLGERLIKLGEYFKSKMK